MSNHLTYIDVLGVTEKNRSNPSTLEKVHSFYLEIQDLLSSDYCIRKNSLLNHELGEYTYGGSRTDSAVILSRLSTEYSPLFEDMCLTIGLVQIKALCDYGMLLRGHNSDLTKEKTTIKQILSDKSIINLFSEKEKAAIFPRITISTNKRLLKEATKKHILLTSVSRKTYYINPFYIFYSDKNVDCAKYYYEKSRNNLMFLHIANIRNSNNRARRKTRWIITQFNSFVKKRHSSFLPIDLGLNYVYVHVPKEKSDDLKIIREFFQAFFSILHEECNFFRKQKGGSNKYLKSIGSKLGDRNNRKISLKEIESLMKDRYGNKISSRVYEILARFQNEAKIMNIVEKTSYYYYEIMNILSSVIECDGLCQFDKNLIEKNKQFLSE